MYKRRIAVKQNNTYCSVLAQSGVFPIWKNNDYPTFVCFCFYIHFGWLQVVVVANTDT